MLCPGFGSGIYCKFTVLLNSAGDTVALLCINAGNVCRRFAEGLPSSASFKTLQRLLYSSLGAKCIFARAGPTLDFPSLYPHMLFKTQKRNFSSFRGQI